MPKKTIFTYLLTLLLTLSSHAAQIRLAILGDSITHVNGWTTLVESALRQNPQFKNAEIVNLGLPSETVSGLSEPGHANGAFPRPDLHERLNRVLSQYKPNLILACYGMNDGIYLPLDTNRFNAYQKGIEDLKKAADNIKARIIFITPPLYSADNPAQDTQKYDAVLTTYSNWLNQQTKTNKLSVIDIRPHLRQQLAIAKAQNPQFTYANDSIHPGDAGHEWIAEAIVDGLWKNLNLTGFPVFASGTPLKTLNQKTTLLRDAWLTKTKHTRPGLPTGKPLPEAEKLAAELTKQYQQQLTLPTTENQWNGEKQLNFQIAGHNALLITPKKPRPNNPWIWRTEFFDAFPSADIALAKKGYHIAYINMQNLYGSPTAMRIMDAFYLQLTTQFKLSPKPVLEGFSRGGLYALNWAALRPTYTAGLYLDAPVCDITSWPAAKKTGTKGSPQDWKNLLTLYNLTEEQALTAKISPIDNLKPLATAKLPILAVVGETDTVVPVADNINILEKRYKTLGGSIKVIRKPNCDHHPHSLDNPKPITDFIENITR